MKPSSASGGCASRPAVAAAPQQSALEPAGVQAAHILRLWNLTLFICGTVFAAVLLATLVALIRSRRNNDSSPPTPQPDEQTSTRTRNAVTTDAAVAAMSDGAAMVVASS
ncbi:hypothetical protein SB822_28675 [Paraburkholderia sp. SIMBA_054]